MIAAHYEVQGISATGWRMVGNYGMEWQEALLAARWYRFITRRAHRVVCIAGDSMAVIR